MHFAVHLHWWKWFSPSSASTAVNEMQIKIPAFLGRLGIKVHINPHMILTPKTVRETSRQVFWLSPSASLPSHALHDQWPLSTDGWPCLRKAGITAAGPLRFHGIPFAWMCSY